MTGYSAENLFIPSELLILLLIQELEITIYEVDFNILEYTLITTRQKSGNRFSLKTNLSSSLCGGVPRYYMCRYWGHKLSFRNMTALLKDRVRHCNKCINWQFWRNKISSRNIVVLHRCVAPHYNKCCDWPDKLSSRNMIFLLQS